MSGRNRARLSHWNRLVTKMGCCISCRGNKNDRKKRETFANRTIANRERTQTRVDRIKTLDRGDACKTRDIALRQWPSLVSKSAADQQPAAPMDRVLPPTKVRGPPEGRVISSLERLIKTHPVWYLPSIGRLGAVHLLQNKKQGIFLVRGSSQPKAMCLSVCLPASSSTDPIRDPTEHYLIESHEQGLKVEGSHHYFEAIPLLLEYYMNTLDELPCKLMLPDAITGAGTIQELTSLALLGQDFWTSSLLKSAPLTREPIHKGTIPGTSKGPVVRGTQQSHIDSKPVSSDVSYEISQTNCSFQEIAHTRSLKSRSVKVNDGGQRNNITSFTNNNIPPAMNCSDRADGSVKFRSTASIQMSPATRRRNIQVIPRIHSPTAPCVSPVSVSVKKTTSPHEIVTSPHKIVTSYETNVTFSRKAAPVRTDVHRTQAQSVSAQSPMGKCSSPSPYRVTTSQGSRLVGRTQESEFKGQGTANGKIHRSNLLSPEMAAGDYFHGSLSDKLSDYEDLWNSPSPVSRDGMFSLDQSKPRSHGMKRHKRDSVGFVNPMFSVKQATLPFSNADNSTSAISEPSTMQYRSEITVVKQRPQVPVVFTFDLTERATDNVKRETRSCDTDKGCDVINRTVQDRKYSAKSECKPIPKPRSSVLNKPGHFEKLIRERLPSSPAYAEPFDSLVNGIEDAVQQLHSISTQTGSSLTDLAVSESDMASVVPELPPISPLGVHFRTRRPQTPSSVISAGDDSGVMDSLLDLDNGRDLKDIPLGRSVFGPISRSSSLKDPPRTRSESETTSRSSTLPVIPQNKIDSTIKASLPLYDASARAIRTSSDQLLHFDDTFFALEDYNEEMSPVADNKFPVYDSKSTCSSADWSTVEDIIRTQSPELTLRNSRQRPLRDIQQRLSTYDNVPDGYMRKRSPTVHSTASIGTVFCMPWNSEWWDDLLNLGTTAHQPHFDFNSPPADQKATDLVPSSIGTAKTEPSQPVTVEDSEKPLFGLPPAVTKCDTLNSLENWDGDGSYTDADCQPQTGFLDLAEEQSVHSWTHLSNSDNEQDMSDVKKDGRHASEDAEHNALAPHIESEVPIITIDVVDTLKKASVSAKNQNNPVERARVASFSDRLQSLLGTPRLLSIRHKKKDPCLRIRDYIYELSKDKTTTFGQTVENFIQCTIESSETNPSIVMRNVRQFMTGIKNYLVKQGEGNLESVIEKETNQLESNEFLNIDAIIEGALHKCVIRPLKQHIYTLFVKQYTENGNLRLLSENIQYAATKTPAELGIKPGVRPPSPTSMEVIKHFLNKMQSAYSPLKKLENLLSATASMYNITQDAGSQGDGAVLGADDFLPMFIYVLVQCDVVSAEIEAEYIWGLLHPSLLTGEGGYYLTTLSSALHVLKNFQYTHTSPAIPGMTISNQPNLPCISDLQGFMKISIPNERDESIASKTLPVRPNMPVKEVCNMLAHKFKITNPQDYGLYLVINGAETLLNDNDCPQNMKADLTSRKQHCAFAFKRKGTKFAWSKRLV